MANVVMTPCPRCNSVERQTGMVYAAPDGGPIRFRTPDAPIMMGSVEVQAVGCLACGHVELTLTAEAMQILRTRAKRRGGAAK